MRIIKLKKEHLRDFVGSLSAFGKLYAPQARGEKSFVLKELKDLSNLRLDYRRTILPPKKFFNRPDETILNFSSDNGYQAAADANGGRRVLFGLHACDIKGLEILDWVMRDGYRDEKYFQRRERTAVIGVSCEPDESCFCLAMQADNVETGYDLFLSDVNSCYLVTVRTSLGDDMVNANQELFQEVGKDTIEAFKKKTHAHARKLDDMCDLSVSQMPELIELEYMSDIWKDYAKRCLSCGSCTMVCPTCTCYDIRDEVELDQQRGTRKKRWDSCFFPDYAAVAGGENFRAEAYSRFRYRYLHKQDGFVAKYGRSSCVGCGRCIEICPAKIDLRDVIKSIEGVT